MAKDSWIDCHTEPNGKRSWRIDKAGSYVGYIGRTRWMDFYDQVYSNQEILAQAWADGREDWRDAPYDDILKPEDKLEENSVSRWNFRK